MEGRLSGLAGKRILVVEDEYFIADDMNQALTAAGAVVLGPVSSFDEAMRAIADGGADFAVLDINLHGDASFAIADELDRRAIRFGFATGYDRRSIPDRHAGRPHWQKPVSHEILTAAIASATSQP